MANFQNSAQEFGKSLHISGELELAVAVESQTVNIDVATQLGQAVHCGENVVTVDEVSIGDPQTTDTRLLFAFHVAGKGGTLPPPPLPAAGTLGMQEETSTEGRGVPGPVITLMDGKGKKIYSYHVPLNASISGRVRAVEPFAGPFKVAVTAPTKMRAIQVPFDFRNVTVK